MTPRHLGFWLFCTLGTLPGCSIAPPPQTDVRAAAADVIGDVALRVDERPAEDVDATADPAADVLTPADAIRRAVLHDPRLQTALAHVRAAAADADQVRLLPTPVLTVGLRARDTLSPIVDAALAADLVSLLQRPRRAAAADNKLRGAAADVLSTLADVVADVQESYYTVQSLGDELAALDERHKLADRLVEVGRARLKAGEAASLDVTALETQLLELDVSLAEKRQERTEARLNLARLLGQPSAAMTWTLAPWQSPAPTGSAERAWVDQALRNRAELRAKEWELAALGDELALTRLAAWEGGEVGVQSEYDVEWSVGPSLATPLPIFDWGQAKRAKAQADLAAARHGMTQLRRQIVTEVRTQHSSYNVTLDTLRLARDRLLPLQEKRASQAEASYKAGETDVANLLLAEEDLLDTRIKVVDLQKKAALARVKLQRAVGGIGFAARLDPTTRPTTQQGAQP
jgi:outer membrane protein TolC